MTMKIVDKRPDTVQDCNVDEMVNDQVYMCLTHQFPCMISQCNEYVIYLNDGDIVAVKHLSNPKHRFVPINIVMEIHPV